MLIYQCLQSFFHKINNKRTIWASVFTRFFNGFFYNERIPRISESVIQREADNLEKRWIDIPAYIPAESKEYQLVSIVATAIAAGEFPESRFVIKKIAKRNPEAKEVAIIAASIAAELSEESQLVVKRISKQNLEEDHYVTQI